MNSASANTKLCRLLGTLCACALASLAAYGSLAQEQAAPTRAAPVVAAQGAESFATAQQAADALIDAAEKFDVASLVDIFGPGGEEIVLTGEYPQDRQRALDFAAHAREKNTIFQWTPRTRAVHFSS